MRCKPGCAAAQRWKADRQFLLVVLHSSFARLALLSIMKAEHQVVGWIIQRNEVKVRLQGSRESPSRVAI